MTTEELVIIAVIIINCLFIAVSLIVAGNLIAQVVFP